MFSFLVKMRKPLALWASVTLFFAFQFILRLSPGILMDDIMLKYHIDTAAFGAMVGVYYLAYSLMQIPFGVMLDRFNFRYVTIAGILLSVIGNSAFIFADNWSSIIVGRFLIGAGSAVGFLSVVKVIKTFFEDRYHAFMIGFSFSFGLTGAVFGAKPMRMLINHFGYSEILIILSFVAIAISMVILSVRHEDIQKNHGADGVDEKIISFSDVLSVLLNPKILMIGVSGGLLVGSLEGFSDVWGFALFEHIYGLNKLDSAFLTSVVFIGMCFGGPILAYFADCAKSYTKIIILAAFLMALVFIILLAKFELSYNILFGLMFFLGILCCYQVLVFSLTGAMVERSMTGVAIAVVNCLNMSFGSFYHTVLAGTMEFYWRGNLSESGGRIYDYDAFLHSFSVIPITAIMGMFGFIYFLKYEKY
jgi:MFS family permease